MPQIADKEIMQTRDDDYQFDDYYDENNHRDKSISMHSLGMLEEQMEENTSESLTEVTGNFILLLTFYSTRVVN